MMMMMMMMIESVDKVIAKMKWFSFLPHNVVANNSGFRN